MNVSPSRDYLLCGLECSNISPYCLELFYCEYLPLLMESENCREQYALALKNSNGQLEEAQKQLAELDLVRVEKDRLIAELSMAKEDCVTASAKAKEVGYRGFY